jgi:hypothetical protein
MESEGLFGWFEQAVDGKSHTLVVRGMLRQREAKKIRSASVTDFCA